jgi:hypothetical protein
LEIIHGPVAPTTANGVIYQVTLASGMIVTSPAGFSSDVSARAVTPTIVTGDGRVLSTPRAPIDSAIQQSEGVPAS